MAEEVKEEAKVVEEAPKQEQEETLGDLLLEFFYGVMSGDHLTDTLEADSKLKYYINGFISGLQQDTTKNVVGIYPENYLESFNVTNKLLGHFNIKIKKVDIPDEKFVFGYAYQEKPAE